MPFNRSTKPMLKRQYVNIAVVGYWRDFATAKKLIINKFLYKNSKYCDFPHVRRHFKKNR